VIPKGRVHTDSSFFTSYSRTRGHILELEHIGSMELCRRTGASFRQVDYWCRGGVIKPVGYPTPGSGTPREWDAKITPAVKLLVKMSKVFHHSIRKETLKAIFENYDAGQVKLESGITVSWEK
jgi:hypothetical protein